MPVYEVMVIEEPRPKDAENGALEGIVDYAHTIIAQNEKHAERIVLLQLKPDGHDYDIQRLRILVRPFV